MSRCLFKRFVLGGLCALYLPAAVVTEVQAQDRSWQQWFQRQIQQHPDIIAAKETMNAAMSTAEGRDKPLYNPELETEFEREGSENNFRIGISQTIDWWDKRGAQQRQSVFSRARARQSYQFAVQSKIADSLKTLIEWSAASRQSNLSLQQEAQMDTLIEIISKRQHAGDLGQVDAELAYLSMSQKLSETARAQAALRQSEATLNELLPDWSQQRGSVPDNYWPLQNEQDIDQWVDAHPSVKAAKADWEVIQEAAELARLETKSEPTFGLSAGQTDNDSVVELSFSIPLKVRNNFNAQARAASQEALSAEAQYRSIRRKQMAAIESSRASLGEYQKRYDRLNLLMAGRGERSKQLLDKQWQSGDLGTTEFLLALQQRADGLAAGIELQTQFELARIEWLFQTGQLSFASQQ